jgi:positive regulator of sigma E activity
MGAPGTIEHTGIVKEVNDNSVTVSILPESACGNCRVRSSCSVGESSEKIIEVIKKRDELYSTGEEIKVLLDQSLGIKALGLGYILPFLLLMLTLIVLTYWDVNEGLAGLLAILSLVPYYTVLSFFRDKLKKEFSFRLQKL